MRTLATQIRLRRLARAHQDYVARLRSDALGRRDLTDVAAGRLLELVRGLRRSWQQELDLALASGAGEAEFAGRHVRRQLAAIDANVAAIQATSADLGTLQGEFFELASHLEAFLAELEVGRSLPAPERLSA